MGKYKKSSTHYKYIVEDNYKGKINDYLKDRFSYSARVITNIIKEGKMTKNGEPIYFVAECQGGDHIDIDFPREYPDCESRNLPIEVVYEDDDILLVNKPSNMVVHPTKSHQDDTLANAIYYHWEQIKHIGKVRFINRLDMDTTGLVLIAKNKYVHHFIQSKAQAGLVEKKYYAITRGVPTDKEGIIDAPIGREEDFSIYRVVREDGDICKTKYKVIDSNETYALLELILLTGRTHQIRVHLKHIGCPIIGDTLYNKDDISIISRQALHAEYLSFEHPRTQKKVEFIAPLHSDYIDALSLTNLTFPTIKAH